MKILITENQLEKLIDGYITKELKNLSKGKNDPTFPAIIYKHWDINGKIIFEYIKRGHSSKVVVNTKLWDQITDTFSLNYVQAEKTFTNWLDKHLKIKVKELNVYPKNDRI